MKIILLLFTVLISTVHVLPQQLNFVKSTQSFPPAETFQVALGDFDRDNDLDAVFANMTNHNSTIWFNDGNGNFTNSGQTLTQQGHGVGVGDLDGDTDLDLFITCAIYGYPNQWFYRPSKIYFNQGNGIFYDSGQNLGDSLESKTFVDLVDYDFDNDLDAVVQHYETLRGIYYKVYENNGDGIFSLSGFSTPDNSFPSWGDLDNDGDTDIFLKMDDVGYSVLLNDGTGNFSTRWQYSDTSATFDERCVELADFDGDQDLDAFIINRGEVNGLPAKVFLNDGTGQFTDTGQRLGSFKWSWIESADVDNDNDSDIVISVFQGQMQVWLNDGSGYFTDSGLRLGGNNLYRGMDLGDLDKDGDVDIFVGYFGQGSNEIWFNDIINSVSGDHLKQNGAPIKFQLFQNYPNPFNPTTKISYVIPGKRFVKLRILDVLGNDLAALVNEDKAAGSYEITWSTEGLPSGVYFYQLETGDFTQTKKMLLLQ